MVLVYNHSQGLTLVEARKSRQHWPPIPQITSPYLPNNLHAPIFPEVPQPEFVPFTPSVVLGGNKTEKNSKA